MRGHLEVVPPLGGVGDRAWLSHVISAGDGVAILVAAATAQHESEGRREAGVDYMGATGSSEQQAERRRGEGGRGGGVVSVLTPPDPFLERCHACLKQCRASQGGRLLCG